MNAPAFAPSGLKRMVGRNPVRVGAALAALSMLLLVLIIWLVVLGNKHAACQSGKNGFHVHHGRVYSDNPSNTGTCSAGWDPAATAEAQALAQASSLQHDSHGERRLQRSINATYDTSAGLAGPQLAYAAHVGAP